MREKRTAAKQQEAIDKSYNLNVPLLPPNEEDAKRARLMHLSKVDT